MRTKLLSALLLASTAIAGVASADPIVRDHRYDRNDRYSHRDRDDRDAYRPVDRRAPQYSWSGGVQVTSGPSWMPQVNYGYGAQVNYGYQVDADGDEVQPYNYGNDPYVEGISRNRWSTLVDNMQLPIDRQSNVTVPLGGARLRSIELKANSGQSYISGVWVFLNDGRRIPISVARYVDASREPNLRLDLGPNVTCGVKSILIGGFSRPGASFDIIGA